MKKVSTSLLLKSVLLLVAIFFQSCSGNSKKLADEKAKNTSIIQPFKSGLIEVNISTASGEVSYAYYIPKSYQSGKTFPLIIVLDPHGDPEIAIRRYSNLADEYGYIIVGPYNFKNGLSFESSNAIVRTMITEATTVLPVDAGAISLCGFSGGAKAALAATSTINGISNVIYCGAAFPEGTLPLSIPSLGVTGLSDMNFTEVLYFTTALDTTAGMHSMIVTHQKHEWPDTSVFRMVSDWCNTQHCRIAGNCDKIRNEFTSRLCLNKISKEPNTVVQDLMYHFYESTYRGIVNTEKIQLKVQANAQSTAYRKSLEQFKASLLAENEAKTKFQEEFLTKDLNYWSGKIASLRKDKGSDSNQRLLGYISLGCYSLSRRSIDGGDQQQAQKFLEIYRLADPENSEWAFLWACLDEQQGNRSGAIAHLKTAHQLGLNDSQKLIQEKWLSRAVEDEQVRQLIASMH